MDVTKPNGKGKSSRGGFTAVPNHLIDEQLHQLKDPEFRVLVVLGRHCIANGWECWPSLSSLVGTTGYARSTISRAIQGLRRRGAIEVVSRGGRSGRQYTSNRYRLIWFENAPAAPVNDDSNPKPKRKSSSSKPKRKSSSSKPAGTHTSKRSFNDDHTEWLATELQRACNLDRKNAWRLAREHPLLDMVKVKSDYDELKEDKELWGDSDVRSPQAVIAWRIDQGQYDAPGKADSSTSQKPLKRSKRKQRKKPEPVDEDEDEDMFRPVRYEPPQRPFDPKEPDTWG